MALVGVWQRTHLFEPKGCDGPLEEQEKTVLWIQGQKNLFIDLRVNLQPHRKGFQSIMLKSFAGDISYDQEQSIVTWNRKLDYRPLGPPDVGLIHFLSEDEIEEDGVLPGDDYKEIWKRISRSIESDIAAKVHIFHSDGSLHRTGYFLTVGDIFAFTLSRSILPSEEQERFDQTLKSHFSSDGPELCAETASYLSQYLTIVGSIAGDGSGEWLVQYSLLEEMIGTSILSPAACGNDTLKCILLSLQWEVECGQIPIPFMTHWRGNTE
jgi:hypothetical protein